MHQGRLPDQLMFIVPWEIGTSEDERKSGQINKCATDCEVQGLKKKKKTLFLAFIVYQHIVKTVNMNPLLGLLPS